MSEKIKIDAMLCALPDEWRHVIRTMLRNKGVETMEAQNREEMMSLLETHAFRGMITISSWLPEEEVMAEGSHVRSIKDINTIILVEPQHFKEFFGSLRGPDPIISHDWIDMPFDIDQVILSAMNIWRWAPRT